MMVQRVPGGAVCQALPPTWRGRPAVKAAGTVAFRIEGGSALSRICDRTNG
jgi:hypothetical protein